ncbi:MAG: TlpA family protein disulfide reductase [Proteobacteria bacterium]|nr:TlpA family protein disulfide reductase [Pseudomonadota bacterium]
MTQAAAIGGGKQKNSASLPSVGSTFGLPSRIALMNGEELHARDLQGKLLVLEYWATWCPFCARQMPHLEELYKKKRGQGLVVLGLSVDKEGTEVPAYIKKHGVSFPVAWLSPELSRQLPKPAGLPVTIVIGRDGRVKMAEAGEMFPEDIAGIAKFL